MNNINCKKNYIMQNNSKTNFKEKKDLIFNSLFEIEFFLSNLNKTKKIIKLYKILK